MIDTIIAGDALSFDTGVTDANGNQYTPTDGWSMTLRLIPRASGTPITIPATPTPDGIEYSIDVVSATTAAWSAGTYSAAALLTQSGERKTVYLGELVIKADPATATTYDSRSEARQALEAARTALATYTSTNGHVSEYEIAGRRMKFRSASDIITLIRHYETEVAAEDRAQRLAQGLAGRGKVYTRFTT